MSDRAAPFLIRRAAARDRDAVARELAAYLRHIGERFDAGLDHDIAHWEQEYAPPVGVLLVVEDGDGEIVGTAGVRRLDEGVGEVKRMWIEPRCQGQGVGRQLVERTIEEARALGFRALRLDTEARMAAALRLYRDAGFAEIADYNGNPRAGVWMERAL